MMENEGKGLIPSDFRAPTGHCFELLLRLGLQRATSYVRDGQFQTYVRIVTAAKESITIL
jgi:hypothetical protein